MAEIFTIKHSVVSGGLVASEDDGTLHLVPQTKRASAMQPPTAKDRRVEDANNLAMLESRVVAGRHVSASCAPA